VSAHVTGDVRFREARIEGEGEIALNARAARVDDTFEWRAMHCSGGVDLTNASTNVLHDDMASWKDAMDVKKGLPLDLDHFTYQSINGETRWAERAKWIALQRKYSASPYNVLAQYYRRMGDTKSFRKINMERINAETHRSRRIGGKPRPSPLRILLRYTVGHGYAPWRVLWWALVLWLIGWAMISSAAADHALAPTQPLNSQSPPRKATDCRRTDYPCVTPALYAADLLVPVVTFGQRDHWRVNGGMGYRVGATALIIAGWLLTTAVVAGLSDLVRRE
jgi:hypothetical protein